MTRPHVHEIFAMSREMNGQSVDIDFGKHETAHHILFLNSGFLSWRGVQMERTLKTAGSEVQTTGSFLSGRKHLGEIEG